MDKDKAKKMLFALASPEEKQEMSALELADLNKNYQKFDKSFNAFEQSLNRLSMNVNSNAKSSQIDATINALTRNLDTMRQSMEALKIDQAKQVEVMAKAMTSIVAEMKDEMVGSIGRVRNVLENQNAGPLYKTMINALAGVKDSIEKKPTPVWNWPQYAAVSVRDKNFANIDPSLAYQHNTTTPALPYGTALSFDSSGTIKVVSDTNKLPVSASVTIASTSLSGLQVNLTKATTSLLSGVQVVLNGSNKTIPVSFSGTSNVSIVGATTSVLSGIKTFVENFPTTQNVSITGATTSVLAGLKVLVENPQSSVSVSNFPATQNVSITAATTSVLAGLKIMPENTAIPFVTTSTVGITASGSGDNLIIGAQGAGKQIYVYAWNLSFSGTVNAKFTDAVTSKILCGLIYGVANSGGGNSVSPYFLTNKPQPDLFHTSANSRLLLNLSGATAVGGSVSYFVI